MQTYIPFSLWDEEENAAIIEKTAVTLRLHCDVFLLFFPPYFIQVTIIEFIL